MGNLTTKIVYPGLHLKTFVESPSLGMGAYLMRKNGERELRSAVVGLYKVNTDRVTPRRGPYMPRLYDDVVGIIVSEEPTYLRVDIRAPYYAHLRPSEDERYEIGTVIWAKIIQGDLKRNPVLLAKKTREDEEYGILEEGILVEFSPNRIGAVLGPKMSYLKKIEEKLEVKIYPGRNGRFVIRGPEENARVVAEFIRKVDEAPVDMVINVVKKFIENLRFLLPLRRARSQVKPLRSRI